MSSYKQQTDVQDANAIRVGSVKLEIGPYAGGYSDIGALRNAAFLESFDPISIKSDNAGVLEEGIQNHVVEITGDWIEINIENLGKVYEGLATDGTTAAAGDTATDEAVVLTDYELSELASSQGDGSIVTAIVVANAAGGAPSYTWLQDCDFVALTLPNGKSAIARAEAAPIISGSVLIAVTTTHTITLSAPSFEHDIAVGDHLTMSGFIGAYTANNRVVTVASITTPGSIFIVTETLVDCVEGIGDAGTITILKGGIVSGATVYVDYAFTPVATRTYTTGGKTTRDALIVKLTNTNVANEDWIMTVYKAYVMDGLKYNFLPDDDPEKMVVPIRLQGVIDSSRTSGDQLFGISDAQDAP